MSRAGSTGTTRTTSLPSTAGIKDPEARNFLDALVNSWDLRSGNTNKMDSERFVTLGEIGGIARRAIISSLSRSPSDWLNPGGAGAGNPTEQEINDALDALADSIRKSVLYQLLGTNITPIDLTNLRSKVDAAIGDMGAAILNEANIRQSADEQVIETLQALVVRLGQSEAAIFQEQTVRAQKDNALAQAINTMWANIGGNSAVIQDGALAAVSPAAVQATKWSQVQAAAIDPNTGVATSTILRQDMNSYINKADGTLRSIYSVRAEASVNGRTVVGGFGLAVTTGAGGAAGPLIDFGVRADRFYIAATASTPSADTQAAQSSEIPFMVLTSSQVVNGVTYPPGVYIKKAVIGNATIGTAQIANASITNALIADAQITTAKLAGTIQSDNFSPGFSGWRITRAGSAEFNDVTIRRAKLVAQSTFFTSFIISGFYDYFDGSGKGGVTKRQYNVGDIIRGNTFMIDTNYDDMMAINDTYGPGFYAKGLSPTNSTIFPGGGSGNVYELGFEMTVAPSQVWGYIGSVTAGSRMIITVTPVVRVLQRFNRIQINNVRWFLFRYT